MSAVVAQSCRALALAVTGRGSNGAGGGSGHGGGRGWDSGLRQKLGEAKRYEVTFWPSPSQV